jgi:hypothetical protein
MLIINCITNFENSDESPRIFEESVNRIANKIKSAISLHNISGELQKIYLQYQYGCQGMPKAAKGIKVSSYSKKHQDIQVYCEVPEDKIIGLSEAQIESQLIGLLHEALRAIISKLQNKISNNVNELQQLLPQA